MGMNKKIGVGLMITVLVLSLGTFVSLASALTTVEIKSTSANPGATTTTTVTAYDVANLGNFGITVTFDPNEVNVTAITGGPSVGMFSYDRPTTGSVRLFTLNMLSIPSLSGNVLLATLTLQAVGTRPENIPPAIAFIPPTPENNSINTTGNVNITVHVTDQSGVSTVLLNWNGANESMYMTGDDTWSVNKTGLSSGNYTYKVYADDIATETSPLEIKIGQVLDHESQPISATPVNGTFTIQGNMGMSATRVVRVIGVEPRIGDMNGDGNVTFDDVIVLAKHIYFGDPVSDDPDVNGDGNVTFDDVILLAKHIYFGDPIYP